MRNEVRLSGRLITIPVLDHECRSRRIYSFAIAVKRTSGIEDIVEIRTGIDVTDYLTPDSLITLNGELRTVNLCNSDRKLLLYVFAYDIEEVPEIDDTNEVIVEGVICRKPTFRKTPKMRSIADFLFATNRKCDRSSYIPSICWGYLAHDALGWEVGDSFTLVGRIQSRTYTKDGEEKIAHEYSVSSLYK